MYVIRNSVSKKTLKKIRKRIVFFNGIFTFALSIVAIPSSSVAAESTGYKIDNYQSTLTIGEDNVYQVDENITATFTDETMHGIERYIPTELEMSAELDGKTKDATYKTKISNVNVENEPFETDTESGRYVIKIGEEDTTVSGTKNYHLSYDKSLGNDKFKNADVVNYYIVGDSWDCEINNVDFTITLPKDFDDDSLEFYVLTDGVDNTVLNCSVSGRTITGTLQGTLAPYSGFMMRVTLPDGYFKVTWEFTWEMFFTLAFGIFAIFTLLMFFRHGHFERLNPPLVFYPPEQITPAEVGYIIDASDADCINALLIYWASKDFITIKNNGEKGFCLIKNKDLQTKNNYERYVFNKIFDRRKRVKADDLDYKFYDTLDTMNKKLDILYSTNEKNFYNDDTLTIQMIVFLIGGILTISMMTRFMFTMLDGIIFPVVLGIAGAAILALPFITFCNTIAKRELLSVSKRNIILLRYGVLSILVFPIYIMFSFYMEMPVAGIVSAITLACTIPMAAFMREYTQEGRLALGKMVGFKRFLETASKSQLEQLAATEPSYFYNTLAFAYVFGISKQWAKKFKDIELQPPLWYQSDRNSLFDVTQFYKSFASLMYDIGRCMTSKPSNSSNYDGGDGGGGDGGGGGGDGGGGW